jgi:type I restriction enzyme S subunit
MNDSPALLPWDDIPLGELVTLRRGHDLPAASRAPGQVPIVSSSGITGFHDTPKVDGPGVVTGRYGTLGNVFYVEVPFWPLNTTLYVADFHGNDARFVSYLLRCQDLAATSGAAAVPGINRNVIHQLPVRRPPMVTQRKIAAVLSAYDDLIENNNRRIKILEEMAQRIYREWFVDFRYPGHEGVPLVDSELGPIPYGWDPCTLERFAEITIGGDWGSDEPEGDGWDHVACLRGVDLPRIRVGDISTVRRRWVKGSSLTKREVTESDVIVEASGECGRSLAADSMLQSLLGLPTVYSNFCKRLRCASSAHSLFVSRLFDAMIASGEMINFQTGVAIPNLNLKGLVASRKVAKPPDALLIRFEELTRPMLKFALTGTSDNLRATRDLLLPRLVSGEIDVTDLDIAMPEAA